MRAALALVCLLACASPALAGNTCYPGSPPSAALPNQAHPDRWPPYGALGFDAGSPVPWGFYWFYFCLEGGHWQGYYNIFAFADQGSLKIAPNQSLYEWINARKDEIDGQPADKRWDFIITLRKQYARPWGECPEEIARNGPQAAHCRLANDAARAAKPADPPPPGPEVWRVKPSGTAKTRVVYQLIPVSPPRRGGLTTPLLTVPIGTECDQSVRTVVDGSTYMGVTGGLAVCERQP